jgi:hypothetical protein
MKKFLISLFIATLSLNAYSIHKYKTEKIKNILPVIEKDYKKCLKEKTVPVCRKIRNNSIDKLRELDYKEYSIQVKNQKELDKLEKDPSKRVYFKVKKLSKEEEEIERKYQLCLDKMNSKETYKKCIEERNKEFKKIKKIKEKKEKKEKIIRKDLNSTKK